MRSLEPVIGAFCGLVAEGPSAEAVDRKIEDQAEFVRWWDENVGIREGPGRLGVKSNADRGSISRADAQSDTNISQQQVSRWRKPIKRIPLGGHMYSRLNRGSIDRATVTEAAKRAGLGSGSRAWRTGFVVDHGVPAIIAAEAPIAGISTARLQEIARLADRRAGRGSLPRRASPQHQDTRR
jgi:hypothetical protein